MASHFRVAILPDEILNLTASLAFLTLPHPRTGCPTLFLPHTNGSGSTTLLESQSVSPAQSRSWFLDQQVLSDGSMLIFTPIDPVFLLIRMMDAAQPRDSVGQFRPYEDIFDEVINKYSDSNEAFHIREFSQLGCTRESFSRISEVKEVADLVVYRYSHERMLAYIQSKARRIAAKEVFDESRTLQRFLAADGLMDDAHEALLPAGRQKAACQMVGHYLPAEIRSELLSSFDFTELEEFKKKAIQDEIARKSSGKPKAEDGKKRKAPKGSAGVEKLKKVNTEGMAKLSSFFQKK